MRAMHLSNPAGLDSLRLQSSSSEAPAPGPNEIQVRIRAASLNFRDLLVVDGSLPSVDGLIPLSDGAGEVIEVGEDVVGFKPGDAVVSTFHPKWIDGHMERVDLDNTPAAPRMATPASSPPAQPATSPALPRV